MSNVLKIIAFSLLLGLVIATNVVNYRQRDDIRAANARIEELDERLSKFEDGFSCKFVMPGIGTTTSKMECGAIKDGDK